MSADAERNRDTHRAVDENVWHWLAWQHHRVYVLIPSNIEQLSRERLTNTVMQVWLTGIRGVIAEHFGKREATKEHPQ